MVIDRLSMVSVVVLAAMFLAESGAWRTLSGALLMVTGAILIALNEDDFARLWVDLLRLSK